MSASHFFSKDYFQARDRFIKSINELKVQGHQVSHDVITLDCKGPNQENLCIDIATIGSIDSDNLLLYSSGIHGVEGFAGSAIQLSVLDQLKNANPISDYCIVFVHIINPYGMAWHRRVNENNVDMNRNFIKDHQGEPEGYAKIDTFLNPKSVPPKLDIMFLPRGISLLLKYGFTNVKQWFAQGQYTRPQSLQYGGDTLQQGPKMILEWLKKNLNNTKKVFGIDLHTGLGKSGYDTILVPDDIKEDKYNILVSLFGDHVSPLDPTQGVGYRITGDIHSGIVKEFSSIEWLTITQEFGTFGPTTVFKNLRAENRWTQNNQLNNEKDIMNHWSRKNLLNTFNPNNKRWQQDLISRGNTVFKSVQEYLSKLD